MPVCAHYWLLHDIRTTVFLHQAAPSSRSRRRYLERANAVEEAEVRRLVEAMAAERSRDVQLVAQLAAKEEEIKVRCGRSRRGCADTPCIGRCVVHLGLP